MYEQDAAVQMYYVILFMLYYIAMIGIVILSQPTRLRHKTNKAKAY